MFILFLHPTSSSHFFIPVYSFIPFLQPIPIPFLFPVFIPSSSHFFITPSLYLGTPLPRNLCHSVPRVSSVPPGHSAALHMLLPASVPPPVFPCPPVSPHVTPSPPVTVSLHVTTSPHVTASLSRVPLSQRVPAVPGCQEREVSARDKEAPRTTPRPPPAPRSTGFI